MNVKITNKCQRFYWPNPVKLTNKILDNVPNKFLAGLSEIVISDDANDEIIKYVSCASQEEDAKIELDMKPLAICGLHSVGYFNTLLLRTITDHIEQYLQPRTHDPEVSEYQYSVNPAWLYFGPYIHERILLKSFSLIFDNVRPFRNWFSRWIYKVLDINRNST